MRTSISNQREGFWQRSPGLLFFVLFLCFAVGWHFFLFWEIHLLTGVPFVSILTSGVLGDEPIRLPGGMQGIWMAGVGFLLAVLFMRFFFPPQTRFAWALFLISPGSWIFYTLSPSSLFLFASVVVLGALQRGHYQVSGLLSMVGSGLHLLGGPLSLTYGILSGNKLRPRGLVLLAGLGFCARQAWIFSQREWKIFSTWELQGTGSLLWLGLLGLGCLRLGWKKEKVLACYTGLGILLLALQGTTCDIQRGGALFFPCLFALGDWSAQKLPAWMLWVFAGLWGVWNGVLTFRFGLSLGFPGCP